jgi:hypothetical protein
MTVSVVLADWASLLCSMLRLDSRECLEVIELEEELQVDGGWWMVDGGRWMVDGGRWAHCELGECGRRRGGSTRDGYRSPPAVSALAGH